MSANYTYQIKKGKKYLSLDFDEERIHWKNKDEAFSFNDVRVAYANAETLASHYKVVSIVRTETSEHGLPIEKTIKISINNRK